jgi:hypothetical protein
MKRSVLVVGATPPHRFAHHRYEFGVHKARQRVGRKPVDEHGTLGQTMWAASENSSAWRWLSENWFGIERMDLISIIIG